MQKETAMATQHTGGRHELVPCGYCRRRPFKGAVEHKPGCPCEKDNREDPTKVKLFERGFWQRYHHFGLCLNTDPSYRLGWEIGDKDLETDRLHDLDAGATLIE
jgi:hypothetical protein